jgi:hypothetical protein
VQGSDRLTPTNANDRVVSGFGFEPGPLGRYYLPTNSLLLNAGSQNATNLGLYHYTVLVNQTQETNSTVDIGYHSVAVSPAEREVAKAGITATASSYCYTGEPWRAIDGALDGYCWHNNSYTENPGYLRLDLGSSRPVSRLAYKPRSDLTINPPYSGSANGTFRRYALYMSDSNSGDPANWGSAVASGWWTWPNGSERRDLEFAPKSGRYAYFRRIDAYGWYGPYDPNYGHLGWPGYASAVEVWAYERLADYATTLDFDGDGIPDWLEDQNGNGAVDAGESDWTSYNSPHGLSGSPGLQVFTPLK